MKVHHELVQPEQTPRKEEGSQERTKKAPTSWAATVAAASAAAAVPPPVKTSGLSPHWSVLKAAAAASPRRPALPDVFQAHARTIHSSQTRRFRQGQSRKTVRFKDGETDRVSSPGMGKTVFSIL